MSNEFDANGYFEILVKIANDPPSDNILDVALVDEIRKFTRVGDNRPVSVWNFYKKILDMIVRYGAGNSFMLRLFDLEPFCAAPTGAYCQADGSINNAPWRKEDV